MLIKSTKEEKGHFGDYISMNELLDGGFISREDVYARQLYLKGRYMHMNEHLLGFSFYVRSVSW